MNYNRNRPFMVVFNTTQKLRAGEGRAKGIKVDPKIPNNEMAWFDMERVEFHDRLKNKFWTDSSVIIDVLERKTLKNKWIKDGYDNEFVFNYYTGRYAKKLTEALSDFYKRISEKDPEMFKELHKKLEDSLETIKKEKEVKIENVKQQGITN